MRSPVSTVMTVFVLLFWLGSVQAQSNNIQPNSTIPEGAQNAGGGAPPQTIADCCRNLSDRVDALESRIQQLEGGLASVKVEVNQNGTALQNLLSAVKDNQIAIQKLDAGLTALVQNVNDNNTKLGDIAKRDSQGGYYPNLLGNMQKPEFRQEFRDVVTRSGATQGRLVIHNPGLTSRRIYINGAAWSAIAGWSYVWVPFGNISVTDLDGATPAVRRAADWTFGDANREYQITYDFRAPWR